MYGFKGLTSENFAKLIEGTLIILAPFLNNYNRINETRKVMSLFTSYKIFKLRLLLRIFGIKISKEKFIKLVKTQTEKGYKKYNKTILDCHFEDYNWFEIASEKIIDFYLYSLKNKKII